MRTFPVCAVLLTQLLLTGGCDNSERPTQVAARVNSDEITVHQINSVLAQRQNAPAEITAEARRQVLERFIDQQLAIQQAIKLGLDRSPRIVDTLEAAKREILARAYLDHHISTLSQPAASEISKYYQDHPELFAQRRVFSLEELAMAGTGEVAAGLRDLLSRSRSMKDIAAWLRTRRIRFTANAGTRAAEQIPLETLPKLQAMKEGEIRLFDGGGGRLQVIQVTAFKSAPVDEATARPRIRQFLYNTRSRDMIAQEMKRIRESAQIVYIGEFAGPAAPTEPKSKPEEASASRAEASAKADDPPKPEAKAGTFEYSWERAGQRGTDGSSESPSQK